MNGYTKDPTNEQRIRNLINTIPPGMRKRIIISTLPDNGNPHDWERMLTAEVLRYFAFREMQDLGSRYIISGGEVLELSPLKTHPKYDWDEDMPF